MMKVLPYRLHGRIRSPANSGSIQFRALFDIMVNQAHRMSSTSTVHSFLQPRLFCLHGLRSQAGMQRSFRWRNVLLRSFAQRPNIDPIPPKIKLEPPSNIAPMPAPETASAYFPSNAERIANAQGFWAKIKLWIRLILMGPRRRPLKMEDVLAIFSWVGVGTSVFFLVGTTTALSLFIAAANSIQVQEYFAEKISKYLGQLTGFEITFESALVPRWKEGTIRLKNVSFVCTGDTWKERKRKDLGSHFKDEDINLNWTYWDVKVDSVDVTLSLWRWLDGRGLVHDCCMKGVRGFVDRRHIVWNPDWKPSLREPTANDFEMSGFVVEDLMLTILNPNFRPFTVSVFRGELPLFRQQWLLYDLMCADSIVGMYDNCLFSVHKAQDTELDIKSHGSKQWAKLSHLKMSGVPVDHMNTGATGPFGWITSGLVDLDLHFFIPPKEGNHVFELLRTEIAEIKDVAIDKLEKAVQTPTESFETAAYFADMSPSIPSYALGAVAPKAEDVVTPTPTNDIHSQLETAPSASIDLVPRTGDSSSRYPHTRPHSIKTPSTSSQGAPNMYMHCNITMNDLRASVPLSSPHISYMSSALIRPIVAYLNAHRTRVPLTFEAKLPLSNFDGAWDFYAAGMVDLVSEEIGRALTMLVLNERERNRHLRRVGVWNLRNMTRNVMNIIDYARGIKGWQDWTLHFSSPWYAAA